MAIISRQRTPKGYAEYWQVGRVDVDLFSKVATVKIHGFPDKEFAEEVGTIPLESVEITVYPDRFEEYFFVGADYQESAYRIFLENTIKGKTTYDFRQAEKESKWLKNL